MAKKKTTKKLVQKATYEKGTEMTNPQELVDLVKRSTNIFVKDQTIYDDDSQSVTVEIHFKPK